MARPRHAKAPRVSSDGDGSEAGKPAAGRPAAGKLVAGTLATGRRSWAAAIHFSPSHHHCPSRDHFVRIYASRNVHGGPDLRQLEMNSNEVGHRSGWARVASIHRPADYESAALTN